MPAPRSALLTYVDVESMTGEQTQANTTERARLETFCLRAQALIRHRVAGVDERIAAGSLDADLVKGVAVDMVIAAIEDLELGWRMQSEQYPEASHQYATPASAARSLVRLTDDQLAILAPPSSASGGFSVLLR